LAAYTHQNDAAFSVWMRLGRDRQAR